MVEICLLFLYLSLGHKACSVSYEDNPSYSYMLSDNFMAVTVLSDLLAYIFRCSSRELQRDLPHTCSTNCQAFALGQAGPYWSLFRPPSLFTILVFFCHSFLLLLVEVNLYAPWAVLSVSVITQLCGCPGNCDERPALFNFFAFSSLGFFCAECFIFWCLITRTLPPNQLEFC